MNYNEQVMSIQKHSPKVGEYVTLTGLVEDVPSAFYKWLRFAQFPQKVKVESEFGKNLTVHLPETKGSTATGEYDGNWALAWFTFEK